MKKIKNMITDAKDHLFHLVKLMFFDSNYYLIRKDEMNQILNQNFNSGTKIEQQKDTIAELRTRIEQQKDQIIELRKEIHFLESLRPIFKEDKLFKWAKRVKSVGECDICHSKKNLTAHHLWDKNTHPTLAYQDENGVCLCRDCHNAFHSKYTSKSHVTPAMYQKFKIQKETSIRMGWED